MTALLQNVPQLTRFLPWRKRLEVLGEKGKRFEQWMFLNASSVLLSEKTGELLALSLLEMEMSLAEVEAGLQRLADEWGIHFRLLFESNGLLKFIVYQEDRLQEVLDEAPFCVMGAQLNYRYPLRADSFIEEVKERWEDFGTVPHEIGIALGYPLDDVFGYMGLLPLACKGVCGWRVYGCMKESQRRSSAFSNARCQALAFIMSPKVA
ncbi:DUF3793 family protein [Pelagicoccus sp. SDUM812003]|uniref:DUF3793 family protein n=1 Tax=Pelagicoccus sp. SDUM812003 TaxID=3041267 RepID=UPI00280D1FF3|nr:DUF3793 family protein [Pelagicoccus sp. SDUM812003]MDQ8205100.1 DUF3793 family protein [Pelagicoccus sp. SDUM812003]